MFQRSEREFPEAYKQELSRRYEELMESGAFILHEEERGSFLAPDGIDIGDIRRCWRRDTSLRKCIAQTIKNSPDETDDAKIWKRIVELYQEHYAAI